MATKQHRVAIAQQVGDLHALSVALDGLDVGVDGQRMAHELCAFLTHRLQRAREDAHQDRVAGVDMHDGLDLRVRFVNTSVDLHFGALCQSRSPRDEESLRVAQNHVVRLHDRQSVELIFAAFDEKVVGLCGDAHAGVSEGRRHAGRESKIGEYAIGSGHLALYVFEI